MADEASGAKKTPTVLRIKLRYDDLGMFVERFAPNIGRAGLFIRTRTPKAVGTEIRFELRLADDKPVVVGLGIVRWVKDYDPRRPRNAHGMGVEFTRVTRESREVLLRVLEFRKRHGMVDGERGLPVPPDDDEAVPAASRAADHSAPVEAPALDDFRTGPVAAPRLTPQPVLPMPDPVAEPSPVAAPPSLAPEPARRPRPSLESLVASMPEPAAASIDDDQLLAFLGEGLDVAATIARARAFAAAGDADAELDALLEADARPAEISIDDASSRLAAMFGTAIVPRRTNGVVGSSFAEGTRETTPAPAPPPEPPAPSAPVEPLPDEDSDEGVTHPVDPALLAMAIAADATPPAREARDTSDDFSDAERTAIADPAAIAAALAASIAADDDGDGVDGPTIAVPVRDPLRPPPRGEFDDGVDVDTLVKGRELARSLPPPPSRAKPRTVPPPPPVESSPALEIAASSESSSGSIDITGLVEQLEAEAAEPQPITKVGPDENAIAANAMNADELLDGMRDIGRRRPPSGPAPDLASFADPPEQHGAPRGRARGQTADDALAALESLSFDEAAEETAVGRLRDVAPPPPARTPTPRAVRAPTPPPDDTANEDDDDSIEIDIELEE